MARMNSTARPLSSLRQRSCRSSRVSSGMRGVRRRRVACHEPRGISSAHPAEGRSARPVVAVDGRAGLTSAGRTGLTCSIDLRITRSPCLSRKALIASDRVWPLA
jgi:hypothetical protein